MKEMYFEICKTLKCTPNSAILASFTHDPDLFLRERLSLPENYLGNKGVQSILLFVYKNSNIHSVNLSGQGVKSDCAKDISEAFQYHTRIHTIDLSNNRIGVQGANSLLQLFEKSDSLKVLIMDGNPIPKTLLKKFHELIDKKKEVRFFAAFDKKLPDDWVNINIDESGSLAPIFTPTPSQSNFSIRDDFSRVTTYYDPDDYFVKTRSTPFG